MSDGLFEVLLIKVPKTIMDLDAIVRGMLNQDYSCPLIDFFQSDGLYVENPAGLEWSLDGECPGFYETVRIEPLQGFLSLQG